jgi:hypothetical protein
MQLSADFTSRLAHNADVARAERELEIRRSIEERRVSSEPTEQPSVKHHPRTHPETRLATR